MLLRRHGARCVDSPLIELFTRTWRRLGSASIVLEVAGHVSLCRIGASGSASPDPELPMDPLRRPWRCRRVARARLTRITWPQCMRPKGSIRSDNGMSSLPERRISCGFFLFRWHHAHTCHTVNVRTATSTDRWPGSQARMTCSPYIQWEDACVWGAAGSRRLGRGVRALRVPPM